MTRAEALILQHNRATIYLQVLAGFCLALVAGQAFNIFEIKSDFFGLIMLNNFVVAVIIGIIGLYFLRRKLKAIEREVGKCKE